MQRGKPNLKHSMVQPKHSIHKPRQPHVAKTSNRPQIRLTQARSVAKTTKRLQIQKSDQAAQPPPTFTPLPIDSMTTIIERSANRPKKASKPFTFAADIPYSAQFPGESETDRDQRIEAVLAVLSTTYLTFEEQRSTLGVHLEIHDTPFRALVASSLSPLTNTTRVVRAAVPLFQKVSSFEELVAMDEDELAQTIRTVAHYNRKAINLKTMSNQIINDFNGEIPKTIPDLLTLKGVGPKIANLVMNFIYEKDTIAVDSHIIRVLSRLGFVDTQNAHIATKIINDITPSVYKRHAHEWLIQLGMDLCRARNPRCGLCPVQKFCPAFALASKLDPDTAADAPTVGADRANGSKSKRSKKEVGTAVVDHIEENQAHVAMIVSPGQLASKKGDKGVAAVVMRTTKPRVKKAVVVDQDEPKVKNAAKKNDILKAEQAVLLSDDGGPKKKLKKAEPVVVKTPSVTEEPKPNPTKVTKASKGAKRASETSSLHGESAPTM